MNNFFLLLEIEFCRSEISVKFASMYGSASKIFSYKIIDFECFILWGNTFLGQENFMDLQLKS